MEVRDHDCMACKHAWTAPRRFSAATSNLSGEPREKCPKCGGHGVCSSPVREVASYAITYDRVTPESAAEGDVSERGFYLPGGWYHELPNGLVGESFTAWRRENEFDRPIVDTDADPEDPEESDTVTAAFRILVEYGALETFEGDTSFYEVDPDTDYRTGEETRKCVHFDGLTDAELSEVHSRLKAYTKRGR